MWELLQEWGGNTYSRLRELLLAELLQANDSVSLVNFINLLEQAGFSDSLKAVIFLAGGNTYSRLRELLLNIRELSGSKLTRWKYLFPLKGTATCQALQPICIVSAYWWKYLFPLKGTAKTITVKVKRRKEV